MTCPEAGLALDRELTSHPPYSDPESQVEEKAEPAKGLKKTHSADDFITGKRVTQSLELEDNLLYTQTKQLQILTIWCTTHDF